MDADADTARRERPSSPANFHESLTVLQGQAAPFGDFLVVRYNTDGSLDSTFGDDGVVFTDFDQVAGSMRGDSAYALALQPDGRILVAGSAELPAANGSDDALFALARYERVRRR